MITFTINVVGGNGLTASSYVAQFDSPTEAEFAMLSSSLGCRVEEIARSIHKNKVLEAQRELSTNLSATSVNPAAMGRS